MPTLTFEEDIAAKDLLRKHVDRVRNAAHGERNKTLRDASRFIGHLVGAQRIDRYDAESALYDAAIAAGEEKEKSWDTIKRGIDYGIPEPMYRLARDEPEPVQEYVYTDGEGNPLYRIRKKPGKQFSQQHWDGNDWQSGVPDDMERVPYNLPEVLRATAAGEPVFLVEGEKDAETLTARGKVGTCTPHGAGAWNRADYAKWFAGVVTIIPDYDVPGLGYAMNAYDSLTAHGRCEVSIFLPPEEGLDYTDAVEEGRLDEMQEVTRAELEMHQAAIRTRQEGGIISHAELMTMKFPEQQWAVKDLIAPGVTLLFSVPKGRKSFLCLDLAISVSTGRPMFGKYVVRQGSVLYLALEDSALRLRSRSEKILSGATPGSLYLYPLDSGAWGSLDEGGADRLIDWAKAVKDPRLIIVDVFEKVRGKRKGDSVYGTDYEAIRPLGEVAAETGCAVVVVHHTSKRDFNPDDPMSSASGSNGLRGSVDNLVFLRKKGDEGSLVLEGRDLNPDEIPLEWDQPNLRWRLTDRPLDSEELAVIQNALERFPEADRSLLIAHLGLGEVDGQSTLNRMIRRGQLHEDSSTGTFRLSGEPESGTPIQIAMPGHG